MGIDIKNELDCVKLIKPYRKLNVGVIGITLIKYDENKGNKS